MAEVDVVEGEEDGGAVGEVGDYHCVCEDGSKGVSVIRVGGGGKDGAEKREGERTGDTAVFV